MTVLVNTPHRFRAIEEKITRELKQVKEDVAALRQEVQGIATSQVASALASKEDECTPTDEEELMYEHT